MIENSNRSFFIFYFLKFLNFFDGVNERLLGMENFCLHYWPGGYIISFNVIYSYPEVKAKKPYNPSNGSHNRSSKPLMQWNELITTIIPAETPPP